MGEFSRENEIPSISHMISNLRATFLSRDFDRAEENLVAREVKLKREIKDLKNKNVKLEEQHQFDQLDMLKVADERNVANERYQKLLQEMKREVGGDDNDAVIGLMRKCSELEVEKKKLEVLLEREYSETERRLSRIEEKAEKLWNGNHSATSFPPVINLENVSKFNGNGSGAASAQDPSPSDPSHSKGNGDRQTSGAQKSPILVIDSDDDNNGNPEANDYSALPSVEQNPKVLKRKRTSSLSSGDTDDSDAMPLRQEEKKGAEEESQFLRSPVQVGDDCNGDDSSSSTSSSSSSDSENGNGGRSFYAAIQKVKATQERRYN
ncbi:suppressor protein SRP40-like [Pyrus ussuriensis x Pyrus communis]|uniref:Suppressor protein SRP40-like n=1 Tax=Pyrus ussuriensis x Pyrus communis TaxID=2448454 RepID=A0A5N5G7G9_9ROSA|nr:suppressor protein SRP40 isoform X1 [Pyrus x bretschneideri]KAB2609691.1 suppressor protein SRP40-like [Pyrus ussuriensis x Pyrus communis]